MTAAQRKEVFRAELDRARAAAKCEAEAFVRLCGDKSADLSRLRSAADAVSLGAGFVRGFASMLAAEDRA